MRKALAIAILPLSLAACGGGGTENSSSGNPVAGSTTAAADSFVLSGQVSDGPIAGAQVCLFADGVQVRNAAGAPVCSAGSDAQGNYTLTVPRSIPAGFLTLVASTSSYIKLASALGTANELLGAANKGGTVTSASMPAVRITHVTTANFALADTNNDGTVSRTELDAYNADYTKVRPVAAIIKAVIDLGQGTTLIGGGTNDTLQLAVAAATNQPLGTSRVTATQWFADPANASAIAAVDQDVAASLDAGFSNYLLSTVVTSSHRPAAPVTVTNNTLGSASLYCEINTNNESAIVQLAFDAASGVMVLKHDGMQTIGSYNAQTGAVTLTENDPLAVSLVTSAGTTYYAEGYFRLNGSFDAATGKLTGTYAELSANTWSLDGSRQECTAGGTITAIRQ